MKKRNIVVLILSIFLTACNFMPQKTETQAETLVTEEQKLAAYNLLLEQADISYDNKDYAAALTEYSQLRESSDKDTHVLFRIGNSNNHLGDPKAAIVAYEKALEIDKKMSKAWYNLGVVYMQQSAKIWQEMSENVDSEDSLYVSSKHYSKGLIELIKPKKSE